VKALFIPEDDSYSIELIAESQDERETLIKYWNHERMSITCEEWREMSGEANPSSHSE